MRAALPLLVLALAGCRVSVCSDAAGGPAFFCRQDGSKVSPAGMNYTQIARLDFSYPNGLVQRDEIVHATLFTGLYDPARVDAALDRMSAQGYTYIRVFLANNGEGWERNQDGSVSGPFYGIAGPWLTGPDHVNGLYRPYLDNFVDLVRRAGARGMYVKPTLSGLPLNAHHEVPGALVPRAADGSALVEGVNLYYMAQPWIDKKKQYVTGVLAYVRDTDPALLPLLLAVDLENEVFVDTKLAPFTRTDVVPLADGLSYDMSKDVDRQQAVDANIVHWANELVYAAHGVDPAALLGASVFTFHAIGLAGPNGVHSNPARPSESRYPARPWSLATYSELAYTDIHTYIVGPSYSLAQDLASSEFSAIPRHEKPLWLGEFGTYRWEFASAGAAAPAIAQHKDSAVTLGFQAWGFWAWDIDYNVYTAAEAGGAIDAVLNPLTNGF